MGEKLVQELDMGDTVDTLGRWMAHHVARLMQEVEAVKSGPKKKDAEERCRIAILELWTHIATTGAGPKILEDIEPILNTLECLNPEHSSHFYYRLAREAAETSNLSEDAQFWLKMSEGIDYTARLLIKYCLKMAAEEAYEKNSEWISLVQSAFDIDYPVIRIISAAADEEPDLDAMAEEEKQAELERLQERLERLMSFKELAEKMEAELSRKIDQIQA